MFRFHAADVSVIFIAILLLYTCGPAAAWNPQPEPPADSWRVEGFVDMTAMEIMRTGPANPFGVDGAIIGDSVVDFHVEIIATFTAADNDGDFMPDDGFYTPTIRFLDVFIGNTHWDDTMPGREVEFQVQGGSVIGWRGTYTDTNIAHPDLEYMFPASTGVWIATDERDGNNLGTISGTYALRDGIVPLPNRFPWYLFLPKRQADLPGTDEGVDSAAR